jgi:S1-C subfamily serine protease
MVDDRREHTGDPLEPASAASAPPAGPDDGTPLQTSASDRAIEPSLALPDELLPRASALDDAELAAALTATPPLVPPAPLAPELTAADSPAPAPARPSPKVAPPGSGRVIPPFFWFASFFLLLVVAAVFLYPMLLARWRDVEARAEAEAAYMKRRAELKAEAEAAADMLAALDKRVSLVSLGFREVVRKVTPNVVNVASYREVRGRDEAAGKRTAPVYFDPATERHYRQTGVGSGILVRPGEILTNHHVVRGADRLRITFASGQSYALGLDNHVLADAVTDLAVIRLPADLPCSLCDDVNVTTEFADSDRDVHRGDLVLAVGSPLGLKQTVTHGIISAKGRLLDKITLVELLQTDAAINPGNSGGPLFDQHGRVAGINVAIASDNGVNQGIGFAIPSNTAKKVFEQLVENGEVVRGYIGVALGELTPARAEALNLTRNGGVLIAEVMPNQPASRAGMRPGDVIVRYNNENLGVVNPSRQLRQWILDTEVGRTVPVEVLRDGRRHTLHLRIGKRPPELR